jgi:hypothetical protein
VTLNSNEFIDKSKGAEKPPILIVPSKMTENFSVLICFYYAAFKPTESSKPKAMPEG